MNNDIDKLDELPFRENRAAHLTKKYGDMWEVFDYRNAADKSVYPWVKARRIIKKYIGKNYGKAFSEYCKLVKPYEQTTFYDDFFKKDGTYEPEYIIDKQNRIQINKKKVKQDAERRAKQKERGVSYVSIDYRTGYMNKHTGEIIDKNEYYKKSHHWDAKIGRWVNNNYVEVVVSGFAKHFESEKDPEYIRLMAEYRKQVALRRKLIKKQKSAKSYSFLTREEEARKKLDALDLQKIQSHGFNEESFKGIEYHGQKRKLK